MKTLICILLVISTILVSQSAMVLIHIDTSTNNIASIDGQPAAGVKIRYGQDQLSLTNTTIRWFALSPVNSNTYTGYNPFACYTLTTSNRMLFPITGLVSNQLFQFDYCYFNSNGMESSWRTGVCSARVTNMNEEIKPPVELRWTN